MLRRKGYARPYRSGRGPSRVAAGFAQRVFHIGDALLDLLDFLLLCGDLGIFLVDIFAGVPFRKGLLRVGIILQLGFAILALQDTKFLFGAI